MYLGAHFSRNMSKGTKVIKQQCAGNIPLLKYRLIKIRAVENKASEACWNQMFYNTGFQTKGYGQWRIVDFEQVKEKELSMERQKEVMESIEILEIRRQCLRCGKSLFQAETSECENPKTEAKSWACLRNNKDATIAGAE